MPTPARHRLRRVGVAVAVCATAASLTATPGPAWGQAAPAEELAQTTPIETDGVDPVLDAVPVDETSAIRASDEALDRQASRQVDAQRRWIESERNRTGLLARAATATETVDQAAADLRVRQTEQVAAGEELDRRRLVETDLRAKLATQQELLRELVAAAFISAPDDAYQVLGSIQDFTAADRRDVARRRGLGVQSDRVDAAHEPWAIASQAADAQAAALAEAEAATQAAAEALAAAEDERDRFGALVAAADQDAQAASSALATAIADTEQALTERRRARLGTDVADLDLPLVALHAYWRAAQLAPCTVPWWLLAGVGRTETRHGSSFGSELTADGDTTFPIIGIPLDGRPGTAAIADTDGGRFDQDSVWDRAVGPMQFIPGTWTRWAIDGNADEEADPHNIYDAARAAAAYLCFGRGDLTNEESMRAALLAYNRSVPYGSEVLIQGERYRAALDLPDVPDALPAE